MRFIGIPKAIVAQRAFGWGRRTVRRRVWVGPGVPRSAGRTISDASTSCAPRGRRCLHERPNSAPLVTSRSIDEAAAILFTSGSTGPPKGAVYTHSIFLSQVKAFRDLYQIEDGEIDLCTFPLFALFAPALGMTAVVPDMDPTRPARVDPFRLFEAIEDFGVTNLFGSPALLRRLAQGAESFRHPVADTETDHLRGRAGLGRAPGTAGAAARSARADPHALRSHRITAGRFDRQRRDPGETRPATERGLGVCVGVPVPGMEVEVIAIDDRPIATWSDDLLDLERRDRRVRRLGPGRDAGVLQSAGIDRACQDQRARRVTPFYHRMGDVGYRDRPRQAVVLRAEVAPGDCGRRDLFHHSRARRFSTLIRTSRGRRSWEPPVAARSCR